MDKAKLISSFDNKYESESVYKVGDTFIVSGWNKDPDLNNGIDRPYVVFTTTKENRDQKGNWDWFEENLMTNPNSWFYPTRSEQENKLLELLNWQVNRGI